MSVSVSLSVYVYKRGKLAGAAGVAGERCGGFLLCFDLSVVCDMSWSHLNVQNDWRTRARVQVNIMFTCWWWQRRWPRFGKQYFYLAWKLFDFICICTDFAANHDTNTRCAMVAGFFSLVLSEKEREWMCDEFHVSGHVLFSLREIKNYTSSKNYSELMECYYVCNAIRYTHTHTHIHECKCTCIEPKWCHVVSVAALHDSVSLLAFISITSTAFENV